MSSDIDVHVEELRRCASTLADTAARLRTAPDRRPALVAPIPGWAATEAADLLGADADRHWGELAEAVSATGGHLVTAAAAYDAADERAAGRLRWTDRTGGMP